MSAIQSLSVVTGFFQELITPVVPLTPLPKSMIALGAKFKQLDQQRVVTNILDRKSQAGIPAVPSEQDLIMERIRIEEILREIIENLKVEVVTPENQTYCTVYTFTPAGATPIGFAVNDVPILGQAGGYGVGR